MLAAEIMTKNYIELKLKKLRWSMKELERQSGVDYSRVWDLTNNGIRPATEFQTLERIASALGVSVGELVDNHPRFKD